MTVTWGDDGKKTEISIQPGKHWVEVKKDALTARGKEVVIHSGQRQSVIVKLFDPPKAAAKEDLPKVPVVPDAKEPVLIATWKHRWPGNEGELRFYSNGCLQSAESQDTWILSKNDLKLFFVNKNAPGGTYVDSCKLSEDGKTYQGTNQKGARISGEKVAGDDLKEWAAKVFGISGAR